MFGHVAGLNWFGLQRNLLPNVSVGFPGRCAYTSVEGLQQQMKAIKYAAASSQERIR